MEKVYNLRKGKKEGFFNKGKSTTLDIDVTSESLHGMAVIEWSSTLGGSCPEFRVFNDSWWVLPHLKDFMDYLVKNSGKNLKYEEVVLELERLGISKASYSID